MSSSRQEKAPDNCISHPGQVCYERVLPSEAHYYKPPPPPQCTGETGTCEGGLEHVEGIIRELSLASHTLCMVREGS